MFGLPKRSVPVEKIVADLGQCTDGITNAASSDDVRAALEGAAAVAVLIRTVRDHYGVKLAKDTVFAAYMELVERQDITAMADQIRHLAGMLERKSSDLARGDLIYFWITGKYNGLR